MCLGSIVARFWSDLKKNQLFFQKNLQEKKRCLPLQPVSLKADRKSSLKHRNKQQTLNSLVGGVFDEIHLIFERQISYNKKGATDQLRKIETYTMKSLILAQDER
jgi:hypothetical protein